jgi:hypothetical protein
MLEVAIEPAHRYDKTLVGRDSYVRVRQELVLR